MWKGNSFLAVNEEEQLNRMLIALADEQRRRILELIRDEELQPHQIADILGEDCRSLSYHLRILRESKLSLVRKSGRAHLYRLNRGEYELLVQHMRDAAEGFAQSDCLVEA